MYGILWLSEGICTSTWASPPVLAFHLPSLDHEPSGHLQQDSWTSYSHEGRTMRNPPPTCLIACNRDSYPLRKNQKPSLCGLIRASQTCGPAKLLSGDSAGVSSPSEGALLAARGEGRASPSSSVPGAM